jgi:glutathione peroxidase-family protein
LEQQRHQLVEYSLFEYQIIEIAGGDVSLFWRKYFIPKKSDVLFFIHGKAEIHGDTLHLQKYDGFAKERRFNTVEKIYEYLNSLPKWNKTKYYIRENDPLLKKLSCETGAPDT